MSDDEQIERVARAIAEADGVDWNHYLTAELGLHRDYRRNAAAAIDALAGPAPVGPPADTWSALADEMEADGRDRAARATDLPKSRFTGYWLGRAVSDRQAASRIRAALAGGTAQ